MVRRQRQLELRRLSGLAARIQRRLATAIRFAARLASSLHAARRFNRNLAAALRLATAHRLATPCWADRRLATASRVNRNLGAVFRLATTFRLAASYRADRKLAAAFQPSSKLAGSKLATPRLATGFMATGILATPDLATLESVRLRRQGLDARPAAPRRLAAAQLESNCQGRHRLESSTLGERNLESLAATVFRPWRGQLPLRAAASGIHHAASWASRAARRQRRLSLDARHALDSGT